jgi:F-type H+-transporting ATPase subunit epsilon
MSDEADAASLAPMPPAAPAPVPSAPTAAEGFAPAPAAPPVPGSGPPFRLMVATLTEDLFDGQVTYVDLPGLGGHIGVLNHHTPLLTLLAEGPLTVYPVDGPPSVLPVRGGIAEVGAWGVTVLADFAGHDLAADQRRMDEARRRAAERHAGHSSRHGTAFARGRLDDELNQFLVRALRDLKR